MNNLKNEINPNINNLPNHDDHHHHDHHGDHNDHGLKAEFLHHFPYAVFSVAVGMVVLSLLDYVSYSSLPRSLPISCKGYHMLFHSFHFLHILFAATGTVITYSRFAKNPSLWKVLLVGSISPMIFCVLSDVVLPYLSGKILGVDMEFHICFHRELRNVVPFLVMGILNGLILRTHHTSMLRMFSLGSHFTHILISSLASLFYMVSHGFSDWYSQMGYVFLFLVGAIIIPCTLSDVIVPMYLAGKK